MPKITDPDILERIALLEKEPAMQHKIVKARNEFASWQTWWAQRRTEDLKDFPDEELPRTSTGIVIYGDGGWHRFFVRGDGEVVFSGYHSRKDFLPTVTSAGFQVVK